MNSDSDNVEKTHGSVTQVIVVFNGVAALDSCRGALAADVTVTNAVRKEARMNILKNIVVS